METPSPNSFRSTGSAPDRSTPYLEGYRFALFLTGSPGKAVDVLRETVASVAPQIATLRDPDRQRTWFFRQLRERAERGRGISGLSEAPWGSVSILPEPARSAFALFHSVSASTDEIADWLKIRSSSFAEELAAGRSTLDPKADFPKETLLRLYRPWGGNNPKVEKAAQKAGDRLDAQKAFDNHWHAEVAKAVLPEGLQLPEWSEVAESQQLSSAIRQPAVLAIGFALLVVLGVAAFLAMRKIDSFPGKETVTELIEENDLVSDVPVESFDPIEAGKLGDWFMLKGFDDFSVPQELDQAKATGGRVYKHQGRTVAEVALADRNATLYVFRAAEIQVEPNNGVWYIYQQGPLAVAARGDASNGYAVTFPGDSGEMAGFLNGGKAE